ncbi:MAG: hypothetical protein RLZ98_601 [Pseudomonadota bacterium]
MASHKYTTGQLLSYSGGRMGYREGNKTCKVVRLLPFEDGQPLYRVKFTDEQVERVVKEFQLSHAS